jgi:hypothetical protein
MLRRLESPCRDSAANEAALAFGLRTGLLNWIRRLFVGGLLERLVLRTAMGALPGSWRGKLPANHYQYPKPSLRRARRHGILYPMDVSDYMDWYIYFDLRNRSKEVLFSMVHEGDLLVDVGTNIGESVLNFARSAGPTGQVFGFEPDPANRDRCLRNLALNPGLRIEISSLALAAETRGLRHTVSIR